MHVDAEDAGLTRLGTSACLCFARYDSKKGRIPSWTDRILFRPADSRIKLIAYDSMNDLKTSDHRPVFAAFYVTLKGSSPDLLASASEAKSFRASMPNPESVLTTAAVPPRSSLPSFASYRSMDQHSTLVSAATNLFLKPIKSAPNVPMTVLKARNRFKENIAAGGAAERSVKTDPSTLPRPKRRGRRGSQVGALPAVVPENTALSDNEEVKAIDTDNLESEETQTVLGRSMSRRIPSFMRGPTESFVLSPHADSIVQFRDRPVKLKRRQIGDSRSQVCTIC